MKYNAISANAYEMESSTTGNGSQKYFQIKNIHQQQFWIVEEVLDGESLKIKQEFTHIIQNFNDEMSQKGVSPGTKVLEKKLLLPDEITQEKLNLKKIIGCVIGFAGVIVVSMNGQKIDMNLSIMGDGSLFLCALSYAFSSCLMKNYSKKDNPVMLSGYQFIFGGIVMIILGLVMGGRITHVSVSAILMLFYLACISAVAYSIWGILLKHNPVSKVAIFGFTNPVFGVLLSAWWLGEGSRELGINALIALVLVCIGICIVNVKGKKAE